ncbi:acyl-CoA N-acyltransferase [Aspergillus crustosus]
METSAAGFDIVSAQTPEHIATTRRLFTAYVKWLNIDLTYQNIQLELDSLPGKYAAPGGDLLLAYSSDGSSLGCVAVRPLPDQSSEQQVQVTASKRHCEMKRLYVSSEARGLGLGRALVAAIVQRAKDLGYQEMRLDTLPLMKEAIQMYTKLGFVKIQPYYEAPRGTIFLALDLTR